MSFSSFRRSAACLAIALGLGACATVTRGTTEKVEFQSEPAGATAKTTAGHECTTPCAITVSRKEDFSVTFSLAGYESQTVAVKSDLSATGAVGMTGNVLIGGAVGIVADAASGATLDHKPNPVIVTLRRLGPPPKATPAPKGRKAKAVPIAPPVAAEPAPAESVEAPAE